MGRDHFPSSMIGSDPEKRHGIAGGPPRPLPPPLPLLPPLLYRRGIRQPLREETREICPGGDTKRYGKAGWERQGPLPAKEGNDQGSQAGERAVGAHGKLGGAVRASCTSGPSTTPPPRQHRWGLPPEDFVAGMGVSCGAAAAIKDSERWLTGNRFRRLAVKNGSYHGRVMTAGRERRGGNWDSPQLFPRRL